MGVSGLLPILKSIQKPTHLRNFAGLTVGVDAYGWLHRGAIPCAIDLVLGKPTTKYVDFAMRRVRMLYHFGITPYIVFDGDHLPSKAMTERGRAERRQEAKKTGENLLRMGKISQAYQELQKAVDVTPEMARHFIEELKRFQVKYVVAPFEADSQLAYLEKAGAIDAILSEDSDLLVFGAKTLLTKLDQYGECIVIRQADFTACREINMVGWTPTEFRRMAILSGCDYLDGIPKMGLKSAHSLVRKCKTLERVVQCAQLDGKHRFPPGYLAAFDQAEKTFLHQWVFCPITKSLVNLTPLDKSQKSADLPYIGEFVEPAIAQRVADGSLNPMTKLPIRITSHNVGTAKKTSPLKPKLGKENTARELTTKKIESFFGPSRTPLAELDPNTLTPSPSQQELLRHNQGRTWPAQHVENRPQSSESRPSSSNHVFGPGRRTSSAPHPHSSKRQRLCDEEDEADFAKRNQTGERSRFFTAPEPSPSAAVGARLKRSKTADIQIHSDDSIEEAMLSMSRFDELSTVSSSHLQKGKSRISVLQESSGQKPHAVADVVTAEGVESEPKESEISNKPSAVIRKIELPKLPMSAHDKCASEIIPQDLLASPQGLKNSPLVANSLLELQALRAKYCYGPQPGQSIGSALIEAAHAPLERSAPQPMTPPASSKTGNRSTDLPEPASVIKETPQQIGQEAIHDSLPKDQDECSPCRAPVALPADEQSPIPTKTVKPKGSEDLLIVPDSDEGSDSGALSATSSPLGPSNGTPRRRPLLDFSQYAFAPMPAEHA